MKHKFHIQQFTSLPSTNDYAKAHLHVIENREVILCDVQTNGRGRFDRVWESGNDITCSIVFHEDAPFSLLIPIAIVHALKHFEIKASIKWPNDILVDGKKVCGILIERIFEGECVSQVVGFGVNISKPVEALQHKASYVQVERMQLLDEILTCIEHFEGYNKQALLEEYRKFHYLQGRKIMLNDVLWNVVDIDEDGFLIVQHDTKRCILKSEEVTLQQIY